jgi:hypothetical protein
MPTMYVVERACGCPAWPSRRKRHSPHFPLALPAHPGAYSHPFGTRRSSITSKAPKPQPRPKRSRRLPTRLHERARNANIREESLSRGLPSRRLRHYLRTKPLSARRSAALHRATSPLYSLQRRSWRAAHTASSGLSPALCGIRSGIQSAVPHPWTPNRNPISSESQRHESMLQQPSGCQLTRLHPRVPPGRSCGWRWRPTPKTQALPLAHPRFP